MPNEVAPSTTEPEEIGDILRDQFSKGEAPSAAPVEKTTVLSGEAPKAEGQPRGPDGKFAPKVAEVTPAAPAVPTAPAAPAVATPATPAAPAAATPAAPATEPAKPPVGWKASPEAWQALPAEAKSFITERERAYNEGIQRKYAPAASFGNAMAQEFQPYVGLLEAKGQTPQAATRYLLNAYATLATGTPAQKAQFFAQLAQENGIDLTGLVTNGVPQEDPEIVELRKQLAAVQQTVTTTLSQHQQAEQSQINAAIDAFAADPAHKHFESVRPQMAALLQSGQAKDLQEAYDSACWLVPEIRASLISQREAQEAEKRKQDAEAAQRAAVTLTGAPTATVKDPGDLGLREQLEQAFRTTARV